MEIEIPANLLNAGKGAEYLHLDAGYGKLKSHWLESSHAYFGLVEVPWDGKPFHLSLDRKELEDALKSIRPQRYDTLTLETNGGKVVLRHDSVSVSMNRLKVGNGLKSLLKAMRTLRLSRIPAEVGMDELRRALKAVRDVDGKMFRAYFSHKDDWLTIESPKVKVDVASSEVRKTKAKVFMDGDMLWDTVDWLRKVDGIGDVQLFITKDRPCKVAASYTKAVAYLAPIIEGE